MKLVIFGLSVSSSWGNGHATLWRGLIRSLRECGHHVIFFERDTPYYAAHRDLDELPGGELILYADWQQVRIRARQELADADVGMVTSYCPDAQSASELVLSSPGLHAFYDLDTPVTLSRLDRGETVDYIPVGGFSEYDVVLSYTGGRALTELCTRLGARRAVPIYGSVDPCVHFPADPKPDYRADLSYLGTYAADRQRMVEELLIEPARRRPAMRFLIGGAMYDAAFPWTANLHFKAHVPPPEHPAFYRSSRLTLNVTRESMARMGWCPSGRLFEAAACLAPLVSDYWEGLDHFFRPAEEILVVGNAQDVLDALDRTDGELHTIARRARERVLEEHTAMHRAREMEVALERAYASAEVS